MLLPSIMFALGSGIGVGLGYGLGMWFELKEIQAGRRFLPLGFLRLSCVSLYGLLQQLEFAGLR